MWINASENNNLLFYVDSNKEIQVTEKRKGLFVYMQKSFFSGLGYRNYNIFEVLKTSVTSSKELNDSEIKLICEKAGGKLGLKVDVMTQLFKTVKCVQNGEIENFSENEKHALTKQLTSPKNLKSLHKLKECFGDSTPASKVLSLIINEATVRSKWNAMGLDPDLVDRHFEDAQFLVKSRLIYSIVGMQETTRAGKIKHKLKESDQEEPKLLIMKQGSWISIKELKEELVWDSKEGVLASRNNPNERWNYFDNGLVPIDRFCHHDVIDEETYPFQNVMLNPVAQLSPDEMEQLLARANVFESPNEKTEEPLTCVIQFVTNPRSTFDHSLLKNLNAQVPVHCGIRLVMSDGSVYSTGFGSTLQEDTYNEGMRKYLGTINGQPTILDYEEFRPHEGRIVTNIPLGNQRAENILNQLNNYRQRSIRFNIIKQNCMRLGTNVLSMSGVDLNIRQKFGTMLYRAMPNLEDIPVKGKFLKSLGGRVKNITDFISSKIPNVVKSCFSKMIFFIPQKVGVLVANLLVLGMGGVIASPITSFEESNPKDSNPNQLEHFERLDTFEKLYTNLFDETTSDIQHSAIFINWQLQQKSTDVHAYSGKPSMNILPPETEESKAYSAHRKDEFQKIYQYALPE